MFKNVYSKIISEKGNSSGQNTDFVNPGYRNGVMKYG